jgi:hypothetical protein
MTTVIGYEGCDRTLSHWKEENTHLLSDGCDQRSSLDISIMLQYSGLRMTQGAQQLLGLLSILPDGLSDADLIQSGLPMDNVLASKCLWHMWTTINASNLWFQFGNISREYILHH